MARDEAVALALIVLNVKASPGTTVSGSVLPCYIVVGLAYLFSCLMEIDVDGWIFSARAWDETDQTRQADFRLTIQR